MQIESLLTLIHQTLADSKAANIYQIDVRKLSGFTDYMIICDGRSHRHVKAIANKITEQLKAHHHQPLSVTGEQVADWVLIDAADVIIHVMMPKTREYYQLEKLWNHEYTAHHD